MDEQKINMQKEIARYLLGPGQHLLRVYAPPFKKETALEEGKSSLVFTPPLPCRV